MSTALDSPSSNSASTPAKAGPAPGWYQDPSTPGQQRFWDGERWTDQVAPSAQIARSAMPATTPVSAGANGVLVFFGWACAFLFPLGGIALGLIVKNADKGTGRNRGTWILGISVAVLVLSLIIAFSTSGSSPSDYGTSSDYGYSYSY